MIQTNDPGQYNPRDFKKGMALLIIAAITSAGLILFAGRIWQTLPRPVTEDSIQKVLDDTLQINQGRLPEKDTIDRPDGSVQTRGKRREGL